MIVYAEWICTRCSTLHRIRFKVIVEFQRPRLTARNWKKEGIEIDDIAQGKKTRRRRAPKGGGSKIFCNPMTKTTQIFKVLGEYMNERYSIKPSTLKLGVCLD